MSKAKINIFIFFIITISLLSFVLFSTPTRHGDGHEYSLITQAFLNHQTPDVRQNDIKDRLTQLSNYKSTGYVAEIFDQIKLTIDNKQDVYHGIFKAEDGLYYGYHFWLYPTYVACIEAIAHTIGANPLADFQIANAVLFLFLFAFCLFILKVELNRSLSLVFAFLFGGALYYLKWTHPEFFIVTFIFLGYLGLFKNRVIFSFIGFSLAATQVITLWALFIIIPLSLYFFNKNNFYTSLVSILKTKLYWILFFLPTSSILFYYYNFGKINLIGSSFVDFRLLSLSHLFSMFFDINQGVIVGAPWLLFVIFIFLYKIKSLSLECKKNFLLAIIGSLAISIPLLVHTGLNAGQSVFERYALYSVTPILTWSGFYFVEIIKSNVLKIFLLLFAFIYSSMFKFANAPEDYMEHKPWVKYIFEKRPSLYNPEPAIFYTRILKQGWRIDDSEAAAYVNNQNVIKKILIPIKYAEQSLSKICMGNLKYVHNDNLVHYHDVTNVSYGWGYINRDIVCDGILLLHNSIKLDPIYQSNISEGIDFKKSGFPAFVKYIKGLSTLEQFGRWSDGNEIIFGLNQANFPQKFYLNMTLGAFVNNIENPVTVEINGIHKTFTLTSQEPKDYLLKFELPKQSDIITIKIIPYKPTSPISLRISDDTRMLGLSFIKLSIQEDLHDE